MATLPISRQIALAGAELRGPLRRAILKDAAETAFAEHRAHNRAIVGYDLPETIETDGVVGRAPEEMRVGGHASLTSGEPNDWLPWIVAELAAVSPRGRSNAKPEAERYAGSHVVIVDGELAPPPYFLPPVWRRVVVASLSPYARKIERGQSGQRPDGVYEAVVFPRVERRLAATPYEVSFAWVADVVPAFGRKRAARGGKGKRKAVLKPRRIYDASRRRIPAIIIERRL